jgi:bifunctional non-homologous end joining protein LigD
MPKSEYETVGSIRISHPHRVVYPADGITKLDLARYHAAVAQWEVPHVRGRPLTLLHCAANIDDCRFMRHAKVWTWPKLRRVAIQEKLKVGEYMVADTPEALISLAQMGVVEIHTWNSRDEDVEHPDRLVFDLDPGPRVQPAKVIEAAKMVKEALEQFELRSFVKTTGGNGLHLVVPIRPERGWNECLDFSRNVAEALERKHPFFTTRFAKAGRERLILIDYLRNNRTNTSVSAFSPRARPGAPVSVPLEWTELENEPPRYTILSVLQRLAAQKKDPWRDYWKSRQRLTPAKIKASSRP